MSIKQLRHFDRKRKLAFFSHFLHPPWQWQGLNYSSYPFTLVNTSSHFLFQLKADSAVGQDKWSMSGWMRSEKSIIFILITHTFELFLFIFYNRDNCNRLISPNNLFYFVGFDLGLLFPVRSIDHWDVRVSIWLVNSLPISRSH